VAEEAGFAYKDVTAVVDVLDRLGISRKVASFTPIGNIKG
jgi:tRNA-splicing ligase RtcB